MEKRRLGFTDLIDVDLITVDPDPIRKELDKAHIEDLVESLTLLPMGPLDPIIVKPIEGGKYQIISGNHRFMAIRQGGWREAPCHVIEPINDAEEFLMKLHANTKRRNLNDLELCEALAREKEIYETFYPETKWGKRSPKESAQSEHSAGKPQAFMSVKAKALGVGESTIRRDVQIGQVVQEIPELKEANATKMEAYAIAKRKPEERAVVKNALALSDNKAETLRRFTRHEPRQPDESMGDYAYRHFRDAHRLLKNGIDWRSITQSEKLFELEQGELFLRLAEECRQEHYRLKNAAEEFRENKS